jgi:hypothetical protein
MTEIFALFWVRCVVVFLAAFLADWCFAFYIRRASEGKAFYAAVWSILIVLFSAFNVVEYVRDIRLIIPMTVGYFLGTYLAVKQDHNKTVL